MKYPDDFINKVICGDCLEVMKYIPDGAVDLVLNDYPFNIQFETELNYGDFQDLVNFESHRILVNGGNYAVINNPTNLFNYGHTYSKYFVFRNGIPLIRKGAFRPAWMLGFQHNYLWLLCKNHKKVWYGSRTNHNKESLTDVWGDIEYRNGYRGSGGAWHPQAVQIDLTKRIIELTTKENDVVMDCFLGSGTTAVAAKQLGRKYIGIEINPEYCRIAEDRLRQEELF